MIYLDNAATSFPKAPSVRESVLDFMDNIGASSNRGAYKNAVESSRILYQTRALLGDLVGLKDKKRVIFTQNATMALNLALNGILNENDVVLTTQGEHNAIMRPLSWLKIRLNLNIKQIPYTNDGNLDYKIAKNLTKNAKIIVCAHINNVVGSEINYKILGEIAKQNGALLLLDCAQSAGVVDLGDVLEYADMLALSAHKGLLSPMGVGALILSDRFDFMRLKPLVFGGSGSFSQSLQVPLNLPDRFEAGTHNMHGIAGLKAGLEWIKNIGVKTINEHENNLRKYFKNELLNINNIKIYGSNCANCGILSFNINNKDLDIVAKKLNERDICVRVGLHCAPNTHKMIGSFESGGTIRASFGIFNSKSCADGLILAIKEIVK